MDPIDDIFATATPWDLSNLNPTQQSAAESFLQKLRHSSSLFSPSAILPPSNNAVNSSKTTVRSARDVTLIQGPPGTGKSTFLALTLLAVATDPDLSEQRTLVCAPSNKAVVNIAEKFMDVFEPHVQALKGPPQSVALIGVENDLSPALEECYVYSIAPVVFSLLDSGVRLFELGFKSGEVRG